MSRYGHTESLNGHHVKFKYICEFGSMNLVRRWMFGKEPNWKSGLFGACKGGHMDIINLMISNGAGNWDGGFM